MQNKTGYGARRAISELLSIFSCQWSNGMLPQIRFMPGGQGYRPDADDWGVTPDISGPTHLRTSGITQPPIIGLCAYEVYEKLTDAEREVFTGDFLTICSGLERFHDWLFAQRDPDHENLVLCLHPWETGTDNSPAFDSLIEATRLYVEQRGLSVETFGRADTSHVKGEHRPTDRDYFVYFGLLALFKERRYDQEAIIRDSPFLLQDVLFNTLLSASLGGLANLQEAVADLPGVARDHDHLLELARANRDKAEAVADAMQSKLWSDQDGLFYSYDKRGGRLLATPTVSSLLPLMDGIASSSQAERIMEHLRNPEEFWTEVPVPSTSAASPSFNPVRYWSGPSWPVTNWLVLRGLRVHDEELAGQLCESTLGMIAEGRDRDMTRDDAAEVLELNSYGEEFTTPSRKQYAHAWLWDSAIVAASWPLVSKKPQPYDRKPGDPGFWEYFHPDTAEPLGAPLMSWTASLFLELDALD